MATAARLIAVAFSHLEAGQGAQSDHERAVRISPLQFECGRSQPDHISAHEAGVFFVAHA